MQEGAQAHKENKCKQTIIFSLLPLLFNPPPFFLNHLNIPPSQHCKHPVSFTSTMLGFSGAKQICLCLFVSLIVCIYNFFFFTLFKSFLDW